MTIDKLLSCREGGNIWKEAFKLTEFAFPSIKLFFQQIFIESCRMPSNVPGPGGMATSTVDEEFIALWGRDPRHSPVNMQLQILASALKQNCRGDQESIIGQSRPGNDA